MTVVPVTEPAALPPPATKQRVKIQLVPWNPEDEDHVQRLYRQRVACGWKHDKIETWRILQREGKIAMHWVAISPQDPNKEDLLSRHIAKYPEEASLLYDSATSFAGKTRQPLSASFIPVGHISLDSDNEHEGQADPTQGIYCVTTLYISRAIESSGLGSATIDELENLAIKEPFHAKTLSLDTISDGSLDVEEIHKLLLVPLPTFSRVEWYQRKGYKIWKTKNDYMKMKSPNGTPLSLTFVLMKKNLL